MTTTPPPQDAPAEEEVVPLDPLLNLLHLKFVATSQHSDKEAKAQAKQAILDEVVAHNMVPYFNVVCQTLGWVLDKELLDKMTKANAAKLVELDADIKNTEENYGAAEVREALVRKCDHFARIGELELYQKFNEECKKKTLGVGLKIDLCFQRIRMGLAFSDNKVVSEAMTEVEKLMKDGDWERRNRFKVYQGLYLICIRDFKRGAQLLLDALATFSCTEIMSFKDFVFITASSGLITLDREDLKKRVIDSSEVVSAQCEDINALVGAAYECRYKDVFNALHQVCLHFRSSTFLTLHTNFYYREVRVRVFTQFLDSYSSVTLQSMAASFSLSEEVLDEMLSIFIGNERLTCKMDRVSGNILTFRGDSTNSYYHKIVKNGDILLNRLQKLSRAAELV